jgi:hypothetical protein
MVIILLKRPEFIQQTELQYINKTSGEELLFFSYSS